LKVSTPAIVIPTYNEVENIASMLTTILSEVDAKVIVVDDNSPDGTGEVLRKIAATESRVSVVHRKEKGGLASAYVEGLKCALALDVNPIIQMDCDFSHHPKFLRTLIAESKRFSLVIGSKYTQGGSVVGLDWWRGALSRYGNFYLSWALRLPGDIKLRDFTSGYLCWSRELLSEIDFSEITSHGYAFLIELKYQALKLGASISEVPIEFHDRVAGRSKLTPNIIREALWLPFHLRRKFRS
jgi:dolichol-phosphate mannosyltransferase